MTKIYENVRQVDFIAKRKGNHSEEAEANGFDILTIISIGLSIEPKNV